MNQSATYEFQLVIQYWQYLCTYHVPFSR